MDNLIAIELIDDDHHDVVEPYLSILSSFKEQYRHYYIFSDQADLLFLEKELGEFSIIENIHTLYVLDEPQLSQSYSDYGFRSNTATYLFKDMVSFFSITSGFQKDIEMAMLQFDEHLIASNQTYYFVDLHHQPLIEKIAKAYKITIHFFELDK